MGQKITEHPQVDYWVKLTREADKAGAKLPHRESADRKELSQYADMERARTRSAFTVILPPSMMKAEQAAPASSGDDEQANDDAPGAVDDVEEVEEKGDGEAESA